MRPSIFAALFLLAAIFLFSAAVYLPVLHAKKIEILGAEHISAQDILEESRAIILRQPFGHYLGFSSMLLWGGSNLALANPLINSVELERLWLDGEVRIIVHERARDFIWCAEDACVWVDKTGIALDAAPSAEGQIVDVVFANNSALPRVGAQVFDPQKFFYLEKILKALKQSSVVVSKIGLDTSSGEIVANTKAGADLFFSLRFDPMPTIAPLQKFGESGLRQISYVDFRIENKVYYSSKASR